jgi:KDO2-lipid IV(A) lauroyltransferase
MKNRKKIAYENVKKSRKFLVENGVDVNEKELVKKSFINLGHTLGDFLFLGFYNEKNIDRYVELRNIEYLQKSFDKGCGVILSTAHFGSWELAARALALKGFKSLIIYNRFKKPEWLDSVVKKQRERSGNKLLLKQSSFLSLYKHLVKKNGMVTLLTDQHAFDQEGEKISFLGQDVCAHSSFVKLSIKTGAIIVPGFMFVEGLSRYVIEFSKPIDPDDFKNSTNQDSLSQDSLSRVHDMTLACNKALERAIFKAPHLWMWQHRRFKI